MNSASSALYGQIGLVSLINPGLASPDQTSAQVYAENVVEILLNGMSLSG